MLKLYYTPNTASLASHLALELAGVEYQLVPIDFSIAQQTSKEYLRINPKGKVPALATDRGVLTETPAMLSYVATLNPSAQLAPLGDPFRLAQLDAFNSYLCSTVHVAHSHRMRGYRWADDSNAWAAMQRKVPQSVGDSFAIIENQYLLDPWVFGEKVSTADLYLFTLARWLEADGVELERLPRVVAHRQRLLAYPLVKAVIASEEGNADR